MAQINVIGNVSNDVVLKQSHKGNAYVCFFVKEYLGKSRSQDYQIWVWENLIPKLQRLKIRKGSCVWITGSLEFVDATTKGGQEKVKMLKIYCSDIDVIRVRPAFKPPAESMNAESTSPGLPEELDGDRNQLPE